jgi:hypothetical protein
MGSRIRLAVAGLAGACSIAAHAAAYRVVDLGPGYSGPINDHHVMGAYGLKGAPLRWDGHEWQDLENYGLNDETDAVLAINQKGDLGGFIGSLDTSDPVVWLHGTTQYTPLPDGTSVTGLANDGAVGTLGYGYACVRWDSRGNVTRIDPPPGYTDCWNAGGINDRGEMALEFRDDFYQVHGFHLLEGAYQDIGTLGGDTRADAINRFGHIAGRSTDKQGIAHCVLWKEGVLSDLGAMAPEGDLDPVVSNDSDVVAGTRWQSEQAIAFIFQDGQPVPLDSLIPTRWHIERVTGIANDGTIAATASRTPDVGWQYGGPIPHVVMLIPRRNAED